MKRLMIAAVTAAAVLTSAASAAVPAYYDGRTYQTQVEDQQKTGACWAYASLAAVGASAKKAGFADADFSEYHAACALSRYDNALYGLDRDVNGGGNIGMIMSYMMRGSVNGPVAQKDDPNSFNKFGVFNERRLSATESVSPSVAVTGIKIVTGADNIKKAVMVYGAAATHIFASEEFDNLGADGRYGYYLDPARKDRYKDSGHNIAIVGWDDNYPIANFSAKPPAPGAWLIKNSWGAEWGDSGYAWISYYDASAGAPCFVFETASPLAPNAAVYEDDFKGRDVGFVGWSESASDKWYTEVFGANAAGERLRSVRAYIPVSGATVRVYATGNYTNPWSQNTLSASAVKEIGFPGWYTFDFFSPVTVGENFAVSLRISTAYKAANGIAHSLDDARLNATYTAEGDSPISWTAQDYNFCIKAITVPAPAPTSATVPVNVPAPVTAPASKSGVSSAVFALRMSMNPGIAALNKEYDVNGDGVVNVKDAIKILKSSL